MLSARAVRLVSLLVLVFAALPLTAPRSVQATTPNGVCADALGRYALAPATRDIAPVAVTRVDGAVDRPERLLMADGLGATLRRANGKIRPSCSISGNSSAAR